MLETTTFDLLVIGGGITGAAVARDGAARGLSVALVEREDWSSGTSWRSSKLIHGGLRYLETGDVRLVFESLSERARLMRLAPHLVRPTDFLFPSYRGRGFSPLELEVGLTVYDLLALGRSPRWHRRLSRSQLLRHERLLESPELVAGSLYGDARTDDARLTLENVLDSAMLGAVAVSRIAVESLEKDGAGRIRGVLAREAESGRSVSVNAGVVVNATGPWSDRVRRLDDPDSSDSLRLSRGTHIALPASRLPIRDPIAFPMEDRRLLFAIPFGPVTLLGTTDTDYGGSPDEVTATTGDVRYLLSAAQRTFPSADLAGSDVVATFASLRPLVRQAGVSVGETSREDLIEAAPSGLLTVTGGKLTTHRRMGAKAVNRAVGQLGSRVRVGRSATRERPFPGAPDRPLEVFLKEFLRDAEVLGIPADSCRHLALRYGRRAPQVLALLSHDRSLADPLVGGLPDLAAEIVFAARYEDARSLTDALARRTHLYWQAPRQGEEAIERAGDLLARELAWTSDQKRASADEYAREVARSRSWSETKTRGE